MGVMRTHRTRLRSVATLVAVVAMLATRQSVAPAQAHRPREVPPIVVATTTTSTTSTTTTTAPQPAPPTTVVPPEVVVEPSAPPRGRPVVTVRCVVRLHGKGGSGAATTTSTSGWLEVSPQGNAQGWGGYQWLYFPDSAYATARAAVQRAIVDNGCTAVVVDGFSNGGALAAKLACKSETFGGTVVGYVVDDPVPDHGTDGCRRTAPVALYWTGALASTATPGWPCSQADWTCEGGETIGIAATSANLGVPAKASINTGHAPYPNPPELRTWLG
jgi:hypothetical protein